MSNVVIGLFALALLGVLVAMIFGLYQMSKGTQVSAKKSNKMMWRRIAFQAIALALFAIFLIISKSDTGGS